MSEMKARKVLKEKSKASAFSHKYRFGLIREAYEVHYNFAIFETQRNKMDEK